MRYNQLNGYLGAGLGAVHDGVASVDGEGVSQLVQSGGLLFVPREETHWARGTVWATLNNASEKFYPQNLLQRKT